MDREKHPSSYLRLVNVVEHDHPLAVARDMQLLVHVGLDAEAGRVKELDILVPIV